MDYNDGDDEEDIIRMLPELKDNSPTKDELDMDQSWYTSFMTSVKDDVDPQKLHELVVDYLICEGYQEAAELLCADAQMKPASIMENTAPNLESLEQRNNIRNAIVNGNLEEALKQVTEFVPDLLRDNNRLHFKLLRQQLVELIRNKDVDKVLSFAQQYLSDKCEQPPELFEKLEQTYALLAFENPEISPFGYLMSHHQRNMLANEVNSAILGAINKNPVSKLEHLFRIMVWNQHQYLTKGEAPRQLSQEETASIAKELFENDQNTDML